jgi:hypothetical protein
MKTTVVLRRGMSSAPVVWTAALIVLQAAGCFRSLDASKLTCSKNDSCPPGTYCSLNDGRCVSGSSANDGGNDVPLSSLPEVGPAGGAGGSKPSDGGSGVGGSSVDALRGDSPIGSDGSGTSSCVVDTDCATGHCVDGVCCDGACDGQCQSCKEPGSLGKCGAITGSPRGPRAACGGTGICAGQCDGNNGKTCTFPDSTTVCAAASCTNGNVMTASVCNSVGACSTPASSTCSDTQCAADGSARCANSCTATSCGAGFYCDTTGACLPTLVNSSSCSSGALCASGYCADGVCCDGKCDGQCESCKQTGSVGKCIAVKGAPLATRTACGGTGTCQGQCDGSNGQACTFPDSSSVCTAATCTLGKATTASVCNGSGACTVVATSACASNLCATDGSGKCSGSCTAASCSTGFYCDSTGTCAKTLDNGVSCSVGTQCSSGYCVDGVCCDGQCNGQCQSCAASGSVGKCAAVKGAPMSPRAACGGTGKCTAQCDGTNGSACTYPGSSTVCTPASCSTGNLTTQSVCNGSGSCTAATTNTCPSNLCGSDNASCASSCTATSCAAGFYCGAGGACTPTLTNGQPCSGNAQCAYGNCVDGVCCNSACTGQCQSCSATPGTCKSVTTPRSSCGGTSPCAGYCDGTNPACSFPGNSTSCGQAGCSSKVYQAAGNCDGSGACSMPTPVTCSNVCSTTAGCTGVCNPGVDKQCSSTGIPQSCGGNGQWQNMTACAGGQVCSGAASCGCPASQPTQCSDGICHNTSGGDDHHCGAAPCNDCTLTGRTCQNGYCLCPSGQGDCGLGGKCYNISSDATHCGASCQQCAIRQACSGSQCNCPLGVLACGACTGWNFESCTSDFSGWAVGGGFAGLSINTNSSYAYSSSCSAEVQVNIDNSSNASGTIRFPLCPSSSVSIGSFSAQMYFEGPDFVNGNGGTLSYVELFDSTGSGLGITQLGSVPISANTWISFNNIPISPALAASAQFAFYPPNFAAWVGTMYIDNVSFK